VTRQEILDNGGYYYLAPESDPQDMHSAGFDGNKFATADEADGAIAGLREAGSDFDHEWVVRWCDRAG
jgi:hypothetical protein